MTGVPRRVLMTADTVGGVWTYAMELCRALAAHEVEVLLATMGAPLSASQRAESRGVPRLTIAESTYRLEWMDDPWMDVDRAGRWLRRLEAEFAPDVVHLNGYAHATLPFAAPVLVVAHSDVLTWWRAVHREAAPARYGRYRRLVSAALHSADAVVAPTAALRDAMRREYGWPRAMRVIPNTRSGRAYAPDEKQPFILAAGRLWDAAKNVGALATVAGRLPWPVCIAGPATGPDGQHVALGGAHALGTLSAGALADRMRRASIYALPARYEPFGLSALEAAMCGCALVLGDIPSLREVWGEAALYVPPDDTDELEDTLQRLARDPVRRRALASRALARSRRFTPRRQAEGYLAQYRELMAPAGVATEAVACAS